MEYRHYGAIGDILKHLMLCAFITIEKPKCYCESNSAAAIYTLDNGFNKKYGIIHFFNRSKESMPDLYNSEYLQIIKKYNEGEVTRYIGSPGLAMSVLGNSCEEYLFCDLDKDSLKNVDRFSKNHVTITSSIQLLNSDGIAGVHNFVQSRPQEKWKDVFVHLDPYNPLENDFGDKTAVQLFPELANAGVKVMLWYGIGTLQHRQQMIRIVEDLQMKTNVQIHTAETNLNIISENEAPINPGILGCGIICCNLRPESIKKLITFGTMVEKVYQDSRIDGKYDGGLRFLYNKMFKSQ